MTNEKIARINELYHKSKAEGLTPQEKEEQAALRKEFLDSVRNNLRSTLNNIDIEEADGTITDLGVKFGGEKPEEQ